MSEIKDTPLVLRKRGEDGNKVMGIDNQGRVLVGK